MTKRLPTLALVVLSLALVAGCAKKPVKTTPTPPAPTTPAPAPTPTPTPAPTPPPAPATPPAAISDLKTVYFAFDSFALDDAAHAVLDADAKLLRDNASWSVTIEGHCDERGTVEYNQALGQKRADAVQQYLVDAGIPATRIKTISYGKERPADEGHDEAAWAKNRRAQFAKS